MTQENVSLPLTPAEEAKLIRKARQEPAAFARLYRAYAAPLYRYLLSRCGSHADAEDLTSQVFLEALAGLPRYRHRGYFKAWLFSIARHRLLNYYGRRRPESAPLEEDFPEDEGSDLLAGVISREEKEELLREIVCLSEGEQELLRLRFVGALKYAEIARLLGRREGAVKKQLYRLLERLESRLEDKNG